MPDQKDQVEAEVRAVCDPDGQRRRENEAAGHTLCGRCEGMGNELYAMYRSCTECGGSGVAAKYGELTALGRWWAERRERVARKRQERKYRPPRDWKVEIAWRLSRWFGIGQCFHGSKDQCRHCETWASDADYEVRRVGPFRIECLDADMCSESAKELADA